jgi:hypothetical protein
MRKFFVYVEEKNSAYTIKRELIYRGVNSRNIQVLRKNQLKKLEKDLLKGSFEQIISNPKFIMSIKKGFFVGVSISILSVLCISYIDFDFDRVFLIGIILFCLVFGIWTVSLISDGISYELFKEMKENMKQNRKIIVILYKNISERKLINEVINHFPFATSSKIHE